MLRYPLEVRRAAFLLALYWLLGIIFGPDDGGIAFL
jgi:hypothetical protein